MVVVRAVHNEEGKPAKQKASGIADVRRRSFRSLSDQLYDSIELASKARGCGLVAVAVPPLCGLSLVSGQRVDLDRERRHQRAASRRRTSAQGTVLTLPLSSSATRRFTSVAQAASASSSTSVSRLSSKEPASAARASVGSASASFRISAGSFHAAILPAHGLFGCGTADAARRAATKRS